MAVRFVKLAPEYIEAIAAMEQKGQPAPWSERSFRNELDNPHSVFLVGLDSGRVCAYGGIWCVVDEAHVTNIFVDADHRRKGIGKMLMLELLDAALDRRMICATLEVRIGNEPAIQMYEHLGFVRAAVRKRYYPDNHEDAVIMWLYDLESWNPN